MAVKTVFANFARVFDIVECPLAAAAADDDDNDDDYDGDDDVLYVGEGQVYTVGRIGKHRVVSTKLSRIGREAATNTATRSSVTRLLG